MELCSVLTPEVRLRLSWSELCDQSRWDSGWQSIPPEPSDDGS
ncbi:TIGR02450 family Trp-rich protein [Synechococcus sp. BMK-MC-1]|nr:TIGR02450 family Trp-rich protein [Synechococcus sp. BMK-MC-1]QNI67029.1 tryptophan-rich conserved hypothetical protein CHP02450 [Synechococcus sp. BMK-MC-1]